MATIKPFKAMRFTNAAGIDELACPPYDIISEDERKAYLNTNPNNIIRLELPREGENPYETAGRELGRMRSEGVLADDAQPALYIYEERFAVEGQEYSFRGIIAAIKVENFEKGVVLPHEQTLSKAKTDRFNLMCATDCNFSQIYSLFMDDERGTAEQLKTLSLTPPLQSFTDGENVTHSIWAITDKAATEKLCADFAARKVYIADGHHRYETAIKYRDHMHETLDIPSAEEIGADYVMMMLVDMQSDGLVVFPTHRIVRDMPAFNAAELLQKCGDYFDIEALTDGGHQSALKAEYAAGNKSFVLYANGKYTLLRLKDKEVMNKFMPDCSAALRMLDVSVLHTLILERLMGIDKENMANQINLTYTKSADEAIDSVDGGAANCAFIINPTRVEEIRDVAAAGEKMPQKSTYFYPKLITGMVMRGIENN